VPFFAFAPGIRKMIYTTNAVEALHRSLCKIIKTRGRFPTGQSLRPLARATDGITAKVFSMLNELAVEAVRSKKEQITRRGVENWKPALEREAVFA